MINHRVTFVKAHRKNNWNNVTFIQRGIRSSVLFFMAIASCQLICFPHKVQSLSLKTMTPICKSTSISSTALSFSSLRESSTLSTRRWSLLELHLAASTIGNPEEEIARQLERAKKILEQSKAKMEAKQAAAAAATMASMDVDSATTNGNGSAGGTSSTVPFFAKKNTNNINKKEKVIKSTNEKGLFTTDGDLMAKLSEQEEWEIRSLLEVFENENKGAPNSLADRDVAASIFNLRRILKTEDYQKIFDQRNRFIGETD